MNKQGSTRIIFLAALAILSLVAAVSAFLSWQNEKNKRISLEAQLDDSQKRKKDLEFTLEAQRKEANKLKSRISDIETELLSTASALESEKSEKQRLSGELDDIKDELNSVNDSKARIETELSEAKKEFNELKAKFSDLTKAKQKLEAKVKELEEGAANKVELGKIIITPKKQDKYDAQVLTLNKEYNFVVINLGQKDGFKTSDVFSVETASGQVVGKAYIEEAKDAMSVLSFTDANTAAKLKEGEKVILKVQQ